MDFPDEYLPPIHLSLANLVDHARGFLDEGTPDAVDKFITLMVAGRLPVEGVEHRVIVNAPSGLRSLQDQQYMTGDFDSLIGFSKHIPLSCPLSVSPIPNFKFTLKKSIHMTLTVNDKVSRSQSV